MTEPEAADEPAPVEPAAAPTQVWALSVTAEAEVVPGEPQEEQ